MENTVAEGAARMAPPPSAFRPYGSSGMELGRPVYERFRTLIYERSGIALGPHKEALLSSRVAKRMRQLGLNNYRTYYHHVVDDATGLELVQLLDAIATNVTSFFREPVHFEHLVRAVRGWQATGQSRFRLWSAACSTGEEPFSMGMAILDGLAGTPPDIRILATDISTKVLAQAESGVFAASRVAPIPPRMRHRFVSRLADPDLVAVDPRLRAMTAFRRLNIAQTPFPMQGPFDAVFCRNVMIYFDNTVRRRLLAEIDRLLKPGGLLFVGHAESLTGIIGNFRAAGPSIYVKR